MFPRIFLSGASLFSNFAINISHAKSFKERSKTVQGDHLRRVLGHVSIVDRPSYTGNCVNAYLGASEEVMSLLKCYESLVLRIFDGIVND